MVDSHRRRAFRICCLRFASRPGARFRRTIDFSRCRRNTNRGRGTAREIRSRTQAGYRERTNQLLPYWIDHRSCRHRNNWSRNSGRRLLDHLADHLFFGGARFPSVAASDFELGNSISQPTEVASAILDRTLQLDFGSVAARLRYFRDIEPGLDASIVIRTRATFDLVSTAFRSTGSEHLNYHHRVPVDLGLRSRTGPFHRSNAASTGFITAVIFVLRSDTVWNQVMGEIQHGGRLGEGASHRGEE